MRGNRQKKSAEYFGSKEEQRSLLPRSKDAYRCSSLDYEQLEANLNKAFDILFEEVIKAVEIKPKNGDNKINSNICQGINFKSGE